MKKLFFIFCMIQLQVHAQFAESIRTRRPGQSIGAYCLGKSVLQVQSGYTYNSISEKNYSEKISTQSNVIRLGILEHIEISGVINYSQRNNEAQTLQSGISSTQLGARINISKADGWQPALALQSRALFPMESEDYKRDELGFKSILATVNKISKRFSFTSNWIQIIPGGGAEYQYKYSWSLGISLNDRWGSFIETYGNLNDFSSNFDAGLSYLLNKDLQLDASAGQQSQGNIEDYFFDIGFSWRTDWRK